MSDNVLNGTVSEKRKSSDEDTDSNSEFEKVTHEDCESNGEFEKITYEDLIAGCTFPELISTMKTIHYVYSSDESQINTKCKFLFQKDYEVVIVKNEKFTDNYPKEIIIPVAKKEDKNQINAVKFNGKEYSELVSGSLDTRLRCRFVVPTILVDNKFICRSGTTSVYLSALYEYIKSSLPTEEALREAVKYPIWTSLSCLLKAAELTWEAVQSLWNLWSSGKYPMEQMLHKDEKIVKYLKIERICDLMIEYNKHFKQLINVSSTEKVYDQIYENLKIEEMPYPGCEFFEEYNRKNRQPEGLKFDWNESDVTRTLKLTKDAEQLFPGINFEDYKEWDLVQLTQTYLKIAFACIVTGTGGVLVHCISGWDRTPLFISLIRLSLWADGVIHQSLNCEDMAYLTVAYDWFLFGHNLPNRVSKNEEVMHFCFNFLQYISSDDFSVTRMFHELPPEMKEKRSFPEFIPDRRECLNNIRNYVLESYNTFISPENQ